MTTGINTNIGNEWPVTNSHPDTDLIKELRDVNWYYCIKYGSVELQIRDGKLSLVSVKRTTKLD